MEIKLNVPEKYKERFGCLELTGWDCEEKYYLYFAEGWGCYDGWTPQEGNLVIGCIPVRSKSEALEFLRNAVKEGVDKE
jgi:hypothetical protein